MTGTLLARSEAQYRQTVEIVAVTPFDFGDARALRKLLRYVGPNDGIPEADGEYLVPLAQALEDVKAVRRARYEKLAQTGRRSGLAMPGSHKRRRAGGGA